MAATGVGEPPVVAMGGSEDAPMVPLGLADLDGDVGLNGYPRLARLFRESR